MPSVGMLPPTPKPRPKKQKHNTVKELAKQAAMPKKAVRRSVPLKAFTRPKESESDRHKRLFSYEELRIYRD